MSGVLFTLVFLVLGSSPVVFAEEDAGDIENNISKLEKKLKKETQELNALKQGLSQITSSLTSTQTLIQRVQNLLNQTEQTIGQKEKEIANLEQQLILERHVLRGLLQEMYFRGDMPLADIVLTEADFLSLLQGSDNLFSTQEKMQEVIRSISEMRAKVTDEKASLEDAKADHAELLALKNKQKQALVSEKVETEGDLEEQQATIAELQAKLNELKGDLSKLTGKSYNAKDIREAVEFASGRTGVPRGVLYGFLKKETNLGANTGQCTYKEVEKVAVSRYRVLLKKNKKWQNSIDLLYKRQGIFYDIVKTLGYSKDKKVSCSPPPSSYIGQGGAMGVSQFMSDVWRGYESRITAATGRSKPDPWSLTDGVMAMALKLKGAGATSDKPSVIKSASINYLGTFNKNYYEGIVYWSKNYKVLFQ